MLNDKVAKEYLKIEENLLIMRCMIDNLRLISTSDELDEVPSSALFGIMLTMDTQLEEIETKLKEGWQV